MPICVSSDPLAVLAQTGAAADHSKITLTQVIELAWINYPAIQAAQAQHDAIARLSVWRAELVCRRSGWFDTVSADAQERTMREGP